MVDRQRRCALEPQRPAANHGPGPVAEVWVAEEDLERAAAHAARYDAASLDEGDLEAQAIAAPPVLEQGMRPGMLAPRVIVAVIVLIFDALKFWAPSRPEIW